MKCEAVTFRSRQGQTLVGILHEPAGGARKGQPGVILPNTGIHYRVAWHRLNVDLAERLCAQGCSVLRFDPHGIGDSAGELDPSPSLVRQFDIIQQGAFAEDAHAAVDCLKKRVSPGHVCLCGFCGGALTSIIASGSDPRVDRVIYVAGPVTIDTEFTADVVYPVFAKRLLRSYLRKAFSPKAWARLLTGKSDVTLIKKTVQATVGEKRLKAQLLAGDAEGVKGDTYNRTFHAGFESTVRRGGKVLFVMAEVDEAAYGFENFFRQRYLGSGNPYEGRYAIHVVKGANHTFSTEEARSELFQTITGWLRDSW